MKIVKLLYLKYILSFFVCLISSFVIFFIFSLIGNLNEDFLFNIILKISFLNSLQILVYVPIFIFLISVILLSIFLRTKNEIIIIKSYMNLKKLLIFYLPIVLVFTILEVNKKDIAENIEYFKANLISQNENLVTKIFIQEDSYSKNFVVFNNIDLNDFSKTEYRFYEIYNNKILQAEYSGDLIFSNNNLIANNYTIYKNNIIEDFNIKKLFKINFLDIINHNSLVKNVTKKNKFFDIGNIYLIFFSTLLLMYIFLNFFSRKYVNVKQNLVYPIFTSLTFLIYSFFVFNNNLILYKQTFELLACMIVGILIFRKSLNE